MVSLQSVLLALIVWTLLDIASVLFFDRPTDRAAMSIAHTLIFSFGLWLIRERG
jgi:hypothetical protein